MKITGVKYKLIDRKNDTYPLAKCSVIIDGCLQLNDIKLYSCDTGKYIEYPDRISSRLQIGVSATGKNKYKKEEYFHPVSKEFSDYIEETVINGYNKIVNRDVYYKVET